MRVLVKEVNWLGDLAISLPALRALRRSHADAHLAVLVKRELAPFFDGFTEPSSGASSSRPGVDEVIPYTLSPGLAGLVDRLRLVGQLRARRFDLAVIFPKSFDAALWPALAGVPRRVGWRSDGRRFLLTHSAPFDRTAVGHQVHSYLQLLRTTLGIEGDANDDEIPVAPRHRATALDWLESRRRKPAAPLVALAVAAAYGPAKEWFAARFTALIDLLAERYGAECVLIGAPGERAKCDGIAAASRAGALIAAGEMHLGETIALLSLCRGFAGNDSGAMHVAGALGIPTVGLYGSTDPSRTSPLGPRTRTIYHRVECSPCLARTCRFGHYDCMRRIEVEEVAQALGELGAL